MHAKRGTKSVAIRRIRFVQPRTRAYPCPICPRAFSRQSNLNRHYQTTQDASHQRRAEAISGNVCKFCGRMFHRSCDRDRHENTHSTLVNTEGLEYLPSPEIRFKSFDSSEDILVLFYVHHLAPSRTLSKAHDLYIELLQISQSFCYLRDSIRSLSASYLKHRFTANAILKWRIEALNKLRECLNWANQDNLIEMKAILGCTALLLQYTVKTPNLHKEWCDMVHSLGPLLKWAIPFPETLPYRMRLAAHYVLANTVTSSSKQFPSAPFMSQAEEEEGIQEIDGSICASPQMLNTIQNITLLRNKSHAKDLALAVQKIEQISSEPDIDQNARDVVMRTADTFRLGALEYVIRRFYGILSSTEITAARDELLQIIEELPLRGRLYTAMHNLWGIFFCAVGTRRRTRLREKVLCKLDCVPESNISPVLKLIREHIWMTDAVHWEDIISELLPSSMT